MESSPWRTRNLVGTWGGGYGPESSPWRCRNLVGTWGGGLWAGVLSLEEQELSGYMGRGVMGWPLPGGAGTCLERGVVGWSLL